MNPHIEWLERRWRLPREARGGVSLLLESQMAGGTAVELAESPAEWGSALGVGTPDGIYTAPLVVTKFGKKNYLQSARAHATEAALARGFAALAAGDANVSFDRASFFAGFAKEVFGDEAQQRAAEVAATGRLALITGGPGTGKTFTLARLLAVLVASGYSDVQLAAPTGKAADRMKAAVGEAIHGLPGEFSNHREKLMQVAESSSTLHKVLQYHPVRGFRTNADNPLGNRVLIVDECSMVDLAMWKAVLEALPSDGRLFLFGDPNQLESVGAGMVFRDLVVVAKSGHPALAKCHVHLTRSRRFEDRPGIVELARSIENSDVKAVREVLAKPEVDNGVGWLEWSDNLQFRFEMLPGFVKEQLEKIATASTAGAALEEIKRISILAAHRRFSSGAHAITAAVDAHFMSAGKARNRPVIIEVNDAGTGLRNGSVGVIHVDDTGRAEAHFESATGGLATFPLNMLPEYRSAWAVTIHRSQGSEYDTVMVVLPGAESPLATRELIYTAVTRARKNVLIAGTMESVEKAVATTSGRCTLLAPLLLKTGESGGGDARSDQEKSSTKTS